MLPPAGRFGLSVARDVQDELRSQVEGVTAGHVIEPDRRTPILVRGGDEVRMSAERFTRVRISLPAGGEVPLSAWPGSSRAAVPSRSGGRVAHASPWCRPMSTGDLKVRIRG